MRYSIAIDSIIARQVLVFARSLGAPDDPTEFLCEGDAPVVGGKEIKRNLRMASLPVRSTDKKTVKHNSEFYVVYVSNDSGSENGEALYVHIECETPGSVESFLDASRKHCEQIVSAPRQTASIRRYLFDSGYWERLGDAPKRDPSLVFLDDDAAALVDDVVDFMTNPDVKEKHQRFGVPYKMNVLLHGPPGSGKTSLIETIASKLGSDVFLVQFTPKIHDGDLAVAMRKVSEHPHPIIVMEDVDCLFSERKRNDTGRNSISLSGFLNSLDGMSRPEGSVVFLTTNDAQSLDSAVTRSRRIDRCLKLGYATSLQCENMVSAFFPSDDRQEIEKFVSKVEHRDFTTADLHEYLFNVDYLNGKEFLSSLDKSSSKSSEPKNMMYV